MCGIVGAVSVRGEAREAHAFLEAAVASLRHRGPDAHGVWRDPSAGIGLGHARLSILDLSPAGAQPMSSASGRFVLVFNGEIYNHEALRKELAAAGLAPAWRGHSDTETVLACFEAWGLEATLQKLVGMFAMGLWDAQARTLTLVRDRMGEKPLYYGRCGDEVVFGSELRALRAHPRWVNEVDRSSLALLLRFNYIPAPFSIHPGIKKLPQGSFVTISRAAPDPAPIEYWSAHAAAERTAPALRGISDAEAVTRFDSLLTESVRGQMMADVPLGAFLSGGYDSSMVVAVMQSLSSRPVKTFTIGSTEASYDEAGYARAVAQHLGTDHTELYLSAQDARDVIPALPGIYDEPFADSSQIPTLLVSQLARRKVTVALTGDGADELLGGYRRYSLGRSGLNALYVVPRSARKLVAHGVRAARSVGLERVLTRSGLVRRRLIKEDRLEMLANILEAEGADEIGFQQSSQWKHPETVVLGSAPLSTRAGTARRWLKEVDPTQRLMLIDLVSYLPGDILAKVDRAAMSVSLETRVPFLDHRLVEFAVGLPMEMKVRGPRTKWVLHELLGRYLPRSMTERPKMGFSVPVDAWLRGPLRDWAEDLLSEDRLSRDGFFDVASVRERWRQHEAREYNWHLHLWSVLMFQCWLDAMRQPASGAARCAG